MEELGVGLIGTGYMGKCHALAYRNVKAVFGDVPRIRLETLCDVPADRASAMADQFGFARSTADWRELVTDPKVDLVSVTTPNGLHRDMAIAALEAGKHVWCEKPMALTLDDAKAMLDAAERAHKKTQVGYNYIWNPAILHAEKLIADGAIGKPVHFRILYDEDFQADPEAPWTWRCLKKDAGLGVLGDMGCHAMSMVEVLMGQPEALIADMQTIYTTRPKPEGGSGEVENEDVASALFRFEGGAQGLLSTSRCAWGRKNRIEWEVHGTHGQMTFNQEQLNELKLFRSGEGAAQGFRTILSGPDHPPFGDFMPGVGHQLGFNDLKVIELRDLLRGIVGDRAPRMDFGTGYRIENLIHGIHRSATEGTWWSP
ncbi:MAG: Gfo/Idh/MocA family oxidoreductase [Pseudomonadota bacterium]